MNTIKQWEWVNYHLMHQNGWSLPRRNVKRWKPDRYRYIPHGDADMTDKQLPGFIRNKREKAKPVFEIIGHSYHKTFEKSVKEH